MLPSVQNPQYSFETHQSIKPPPLLNIPSEGISFGNNQDDTGLSMRDSIGDSSTTETMNNILKVLSKAPEARKQKESKLLMDFSDQHKYFAQLSEKVSVDLVKIILNKFRDVVYLKKGTVLAKQGEKITKLGILLFGKMSRINIKNKIVSSLPSENDLQNIYEKLGIIAHSQVKEINRVIKKGKNFEEGNSASPKIPLKQKYQSIQQLLQYSNMSKSISSSIEQMQDKLQKKPQETFQSGISDQAFGQKFLNTIVIDENAWILRIPQTQFLIQYNIIVQKKLGALYDKLKGIPGFSYLDKDIIEAIILSLKSRNRSLGFHLYEQGDVADSLFLLTEGQVKISKKCKLFEENPNELYSNRVKLILDQERQITIKRNIGKNEKREPRYEIKQLQSKRAEAALPYANLTSMYNYQPRNKKIQIGTINAFCLFGEEQLIDMEFDRNQGNIRNSQIKQPQYKIRETEAKCESVQINYYEISFNRIFQILGKQSVNHFIQGLKQYSTSKIIRRQSQFAQTINFENSQNLNYFYDQDHVEGSGKKFRISKINNKLMEHQTTISVGSRGNSNKKKQFLDRMVSPYYTTFNFNKLRQTSRVAPVEENIVVNSTGLNKKQKNNVRPNTQMTKTVNVSLKKSMGKNDSEQNSQYDITDQPLPQQMKILSMSHTWKLVKRRVNQEQFKSSKISPVKYFIGVNNPLIDNEFLRKKDILSRKIERDIRKNKITPSLSKKKQKNPIQIQKHIRLSLTKK